ncbi:signal peptide peptidase SppA [Deinococcus cellulosilyticus]|uniref:Peptidase n=1 Tax=Deinococcus cellulosilyticus (strain DSM 18568 / NBRC 106333 / KACC 11606 / 5516J-15) TaxID=1223518 RepID=A0A511N3E5_DEIC1|nr:signal peptide peptidase SppA [Deinococcus cellulosilyticus]GEM47380.1 peptidase [Deinococcus cellulosilyticus NBRC 106333 = KACC 11606]
MKSEIQNKIYNFVAGVQHQIADLGEKPGWVILDVQGEFPEFPEKSPLNIITRKEPQGVSVFRRKLKLLEDADWLRGVVLRFGGVQAGLATAFALREAIERLASKKPVYSVVNSVHMMDYYLASAGTEVVVPPSAEFYLLGFHSQVTYIKDALQKLGIEMEVVRIKEYKTAYTRFTDDHMDEYEREQRSLLVSRFMEEFVRAVAQSRNLSEAQVREAIDAGITNAEQARQHGLVDRIAYEDVLYSKKHQPFNQASRFLKLPLMPEQGGKVAVVSLEGMIVPGHSRHVPIPLPIFGEQMAGSESIIRSLRTAEKDEDTKAIVLFVNSGGGSALASDLISHEVERIRAKKPVVAVMGNVAASGGYYVLTHANHVIAAPTTITGSIGVISGKPNLQGFNAKYGLNPESIKVGRLADSFDTAHPLTEEERAFLQKGAEDFYDLFTTRVSEGRNLSKERVNELGRGRVWSGKDALDNGLVDELGTLENGIQRARKLAGLPENAPAYLLETPKQMVLPDMKDSESVLAAIMPLLRERTWMVAYERYNLK